MIHIWTKIPLRFQKPGIDPLAVKPGEEFKALFFQSKPGEYQEAPDWITQDNLWALALRDGNLIQAEAPAVRVANLGLQSIAENRELAARGLDGAPNPPTPTTQEAYERETRSTEIRGTESAPSNPDRRFESAPTLTPTGPAYPNPSYPSKVNPPDVRDQVHGLSSAANPAANPAVDLNKMTKPELVTHAQTVHGIALDPNISKADLVAAIQEKAQTGGA